MVFDTLRVRNGGAVLFAEIKAPPMNDFRRDSDLFVELVRNPEAQKRIQSAMQRGFQTREPEMALGRFVEDLANVP